MPKVKVKVAQSCSTLCDPMNCTVHGILQPRILMWVAFPFSRGSFQPRDQTQVFHISGRFFTSPTPKRHMKRWSASLIIKEIQIKTIIRHHLKPVRKATIKKSMNNKCWRGCGEKGTLLHGWWECNWYSHYGEQYGSSLKNKNKTTIWSRNPTPGHISGEKYNSKRYTHPIYIVALFLTATTQKRQKCPSAEGWVKKMGHTHNGILLSCEKAKIVPTAMTWGDKEIVRLSKVSPIEKGKYHTLSLTHGI